MSDSNKPPKPPPDDFSKTTPNINLPDEDDSAGDWNKTNYRYPEQPQADDWGNTVANINTNDDEFSAFAPGANDPKVPDWGITRSDITVDPNDFGPSDGSSQRGGEEPINVTVPYFKLPQADIEKYIKPNKKAEAEAEEQNRVEEEKKKKSIPAWLWISSALFMMFFFTIIVLGGVYFYITRNSGFEVTITNVPKGSEIFVNNGPWKESTSDSTTKKLPLLKAGEEKKIEIINPNYECDTIFIPSSQRLEPLTFTAKCRQGQVSLEPPKECLEIKAGDYAKSRECAYKALAKLPDPPPIEALLAAMNLYINQFDSGKHAIRDEDRKFLDKAAGYMKKIPQDIVIEVGGHTDSDGTDSDNQALSERRAKAVKDALVELGIKESMLVTKGYGESQPKTDNTTDDGKFRNRRIQYSIYKGG